MEGGWTVLAEVAKRQGERRGEQEAAAATQTGGTKCICAARGPAVKLGHRGRVGGSLGEDGASAYAALGRRGAWAGGGAVGGAGAQLLTGAACTLPGAAWKPPPWTSELLHPLGTPFLKS